MTSFAIHPEQLKINLADVLGAQVSDITVALGEVTVTVPAANYLSVS